jgi:hypothetical protein
MSKQKTARNTRKGGGKKKAAGVSGGTRTRSAKEVPTARHSDAARRATISRNAKATGATSAEKRHAGIGRS